MKGFVTGVLSMLAAVCVIVLLAKPATFNSLWPQRNETTQQGTPSNSGEPPIAGSQRKPPADPKTALIGKWISPGGEIVEFHSGTTAEVSQWTGQQREVGVLDYEVLADGKIRLRGPLGSSIINFSDIRSDSVKLGLGGNMAEYRRYVPGTPELQAVALGDSKTQLSFTFQEGYSRAHLTLSRARSVRLTNAGSGVMCWRTAFDEAVRGPRGETLPWSVVETKVSQNAPLFARESSEVEFTGQLRPFVLRQNPKGTFRGKLHIHWECGTDIRETALDTEVTFVEQTPQRIIPGRRIDLSLEDGEHRWFQFNVKPQHAYAIVADCPNAEITPFEGERFGIATLFDVSKRPLVAHTRDPLLGQGEDHSRYYNFHKHHVVAMRDDINASEILLRVAVGSSLKGSVRIAVNEAKPAPTNTDFTWGQRLEIKAGNSWSAVPFEGRARADYVIRVSERTGQGNNGIAAFVVPQRVVNELSRGGKIQQDTLYRLSGKGTLGGPELPWGPSETYDYWHCEESQTYCLLVARGSNNELRFGPDANVRFGPRVWVFETQQP